MSSATISLQVVYLLFNIASYYRCILSSVDIRGAFLNAEFIPADSPLYLKINKDVVPYWVKQDPNAVPYVSSTGEIILLVRLETVSSEAGYRQSINNECLFYKRTTSGFSYISTHSDELLLSCSSKTLAQEFRNTLI